MLFKKVVWIESQIKMIISGTILFKSFRPNVLFDTEPGLELPEIYRDHPRPSSLWCCARNILNALRETLTQYIKFNREGGEESVLWFCLGCFKVAH